MAKISHGDTKMVDNSSLILAALAFLILYVLIHVRKDRFVLHMLNGMQSNPTRTKQVAKRKTVTRPRKVRSRRRR